VETFHRPLRLATGGLILAGVGLTGLACVLSFARVSAGQGFLFLVVALALTALATAVLRGARWAIVVALVLGAAQVVGIVGSALQLADHVDPTKAAGQRQIGFDPVLAVTINLIYSTIAFVLFGWWAWRWWRARRPTVS
jgi:hypothetical protein